MINNRAFSAKIFNQEILHVYRRGEVHRIRAICISVSPFCFDSFELRMRMDAKSVKINVKIAHRIVRRVACMRTDECGWWDSGQVDTNQFWKTFLGYKNIYTYYMNIFPADNCDNFELMQTAVDTSSKIHEMYREIPST